MSIEEIINGLDSIAREKQAKNAGLPDGWPLDTGLLDDETVLREAIALLETHPEAQPNEPLTLDELREMEYCPVWTETKGVSGSGRWELVVDAECEKRLKMASGEDEIYEVYTDSYGKTWIAFRRPPKEEAEK